MSNPKNCFGLVTACAPAVAAIASTSARDMIIERIARVSFDSLQDEA
jgi:hypothetical protein